MGFVGKNLGLCKNDYRNWGTFYAWFLALKIKDSLKIDEYGDISAKRYFRSYSK